MTTHCALTPPATRSYVRGRRCTYSPCRGRTAGSACAHSKPWSVTSSAWALSRWVQHGMEAQLHHCISLPPHPTFLLYRGGHRIAYAACHVTCTPNRQAHASIWRDAAGREEIVVYFVPTASADFSKLDAFLNSQVRNSFSFLRHCLLLRRAWAPILTRRCPCSLCSGGPVPHHVDRLAAAQRHGRCGPAPPAHAAGCGRRLLRVRAVCSRTRAGSARCSAGQRRGRRGGATTAAAGCRHVAAGAAGTTGAAGAGCRHVAAAAAGAPGRAEAFDRSGGDLAGHTGAAARDAAGGAADERGALGR